MKIDKEKPKIFYYKIFGLKDLKEKDINLFLEAINKILHIKFEACKSEKRLEHIQIGFIKVKELSHQKLKFSKLSLIFETKIFNIIIIQDTLKSMEGCYVGQFHGPFNKMENIQIRKELTKLIFSNVNDLKGYELRLKYYSNESRWNFYVDDIKIAERVSTEMNDREFLIGKYYIKFIKSKRLVVERENMNINMNNDRYKGIKQDIVMELMKIDLSKQQKLSVKFQEDIKIINKKLIEIINYIGLSNIKKWTEIHRWKGRKNENIERSDDIGNDDYNNKDKNNLKNINEKRNENENKNKNELKQLEVIDRVESPQKPIELNFLRNQMEHAENEMILIENEINSTDITEEEYEERKLKLKLLQKKLTYLSNLKIADSTMENKTIEVNQENKKQNLINKTKKQVHFALDEHNTMENTIHEREINKITETIHIENKNLKIKKNKKNK